MKSNKASKRLIAAREYLDRGMYSVPIPSMSKSPKLKGWQKLRLSGSDLDNQFSREGNIGVLLGEPSGGIVDVDLDCAEAVAMADALLPPTNSIFGRASKLKSHRLYRAIGTFKTAPYKYVDGTMIVEGRSTGGQTVFPPSVHPSGEVINWHEDGELASIDAEELRAKISQLAAAVVVVRHYPETGSRNDLCLCVANILARHGLPESDIENILVTIALTAADEEAEARGKVAHYAVEGHSAGEPRFGVPHLIELIGERPAKRFCELLGIRLAKPGKVSHGEAGLTATLASCELWHIAEGRSYASFTRNGHQEHWAVKSVRFRSLIRPVILARIGKMPSSSILDEVTDTADGMAQMGSVHSVAMRSTVFDGKVYVDLVNEAWEVVEITRDGWQVITNSPVRFIRSRGMSQLPHPVTGGSLDALHRHFNVADNDDFWLLVGFIIAAHRGVGPYPIGAINGEQGSAKSTAVRMIRELIDPNSASVRALPRTEDDLYVAASNGFILSFDNVSTLPSSVSDTLCRISTGGGFSKRELYSDLDEIIIDVCRPILMNGIPSLVDRADLMDRTIALTLPAIPPDKLRPERAVWQEFMADLPLMLGAVFSAISAGLRHSPEIDIKESPRLIDLVIFMTAVERGLGFEEGRFHRIYSAHQRQARVDFAGSDPLVAVIEDIIRDAEFSGTATQLMAEVREVVAKKHNRWPVGIPQMPNRLVGALRRLTPALRELGIEVVLESGRDEANRKVIRISGEQSGRM